jgi:hypothetical protein
MHARAIPTATRRMQTCDLTCVVQTQRDVVAARGANEQIRGGKAVAVVWVRGRGLAVAITANDIRYKHVTRQFEITSKDDLSARGG